MGNNLFNPDGGFWRTITAIGDVIGLSILWLLLCVPIVTIGPATSALYYSIIKCVKPMKNGAFICFFKSFKANLKVGIFSTIIVLVISLAVSSAIWITYEMAKSGVGYAYVLFFSEIVLSLFIIGFMCYLFPTLSRYEYSIKELFKICLSLSFTHLLSTILLAILLLLSIFILWYFWVFIALVPAILQILNSYILERIYRIHSGEEK